MRNAERIVDSVVLSVSGAYSLANIEHILGIIILSIEIAWIAVKLIIKIVTAIKNKQDLSIFDGDVSSLIGSIGDIADKVNSDDKECDDNDTES